ncbi:MAG: GAF domain-containing protein [bacterium]
MGVADSIGLAIYQSNLYEKQKNTLRRDSVLRQLTETIRSSLDMKEMKQTIVNEIGKIFEADRCYLREYNQEEGAFLKPEVEYLSSDKIKSLKDVEPNQKGLSYFFEKVKLKKEMLPVEVTHHFFEDQIIKYPALEEYFRQSGIKSDFAIPIWCKKKKLTFLVLHYKERVELSDENRELLVALSKQISIALEHSTLYDEAQVQVDRERITRKTVETIRSSLELKSILESVSKELLGYIKDVQRVFIGKMRFRERQDFTEVSVNSDIKKFSQVNNDVYKIAADYWEDYYVTTRRNKIINNLEESDMPPEVKHIYINMGVKSIIGLPIKLEEKIWGGLFLSSIDNYKKWTEDEIVFLESIVNQLDVAIKQSELYEKEKKTAQREALLRQIIETIRSSIDIDKTLTIICAEVAKIFNVQRATIVEFFDKSDFSKWIVREEYKEYEAVKGLEDIDYDRRAGAYNGQKVLQEGQNLVIENLQSSNLPEYYKKTYQALEVKSILSVPIRRDEDKFGIIFLSVADEFRAWKQEDVYLLESIASQVYVAIRQSELYEKEKQSAQRERMLRELVNMVRQSIDINEIIHSLVFESGIMFKAQRSFFSKYNKELNTFLIPDEYSEYLESSNEISFRRYGKDFSECYGFFVKALISNKKTFFWTDSEKLIKEYDLENTVDAQNLREDKVGSGLLVPIVYEDNLFGIYVLTHEKTNGMNEEMVNYMEQIAEQTSIAMNQAVLLEKEKQSAKREVLLRKIIEIIRSSIDIDFIKHEIVNQIGDFLKADRVAFADYDFEQGQYFVLQGNEYLSSPDVKTFVGLDFISITGFIEFIRKIHLKGEDIIFSDLDKYLEEKNLKGSGVEDFYRDMGFMSSMAINIYHGDMFFGDLVITFEQKRNISQADIDFIKTVTNQAGIAIYQSNLYQKEKQALERERIIKNSITFIRGSLDVKEIKKTFIIEISRYLDSDFNTFYEFDTKSRKFITLEKDSFYLSSSDIKNPEGLNIEDYGWGDFFRINPPEVIYSDIEDFKKDYNLYGTVGEDFLNKFGIKSCIVIPVVYKDDLLGVLGINYIKKYKKINEDDINFVRTLANQAGIALHQAELTEQQRKSLEKEILLKEITETIRGTLDIKQMKKLIVDSIGKAFGADLCLLIEAESYTNKLFVLDEFSEYRSSNDIYSLVGIDFEQEAQIKFMKDANKEIKELFIPDTKKFIKENNLQGSLEEKFFEKSKMKTALGISLFYKNEFIGILGLYFMKDKKYFSEEDRNFTRILAIQAGNALNQSRLYEFQRKIAYKESILKDIISEIKLTRDLNHAYNKLLHKLSDIFNLNRTLFLESSKINPDELEIKYEYVIDRKDLSVNNLVFPQVCIDEFLNLVHNLEPLILDDVARCYPEKTSDFFQKYKIQALISVPLVKYNGETKVLGFIVLCSENIRIWTSDEIDLIKSISDSVVSVIWEISKFIETEELRNSFVLTLAHDFQVPLVGERTAIEYLLDYSECSFGNNREILQEILENNQNISTLLEKSVDIYNYEANKKKLDLEKVKLSIVLQEAIFIAKAEDKSGKAKINLKSMIEDFVVKIDKQEILKVFSVLIDNAVVHSTEEKEVTIDCYKKHNRIIISVHNMGKPIPADIQEKLFNRYEMALAIERKIGAGTGLFLSKRIVEAHKGYIWFDTSKEHGTTYYVSLAFVNN